VNATEGGVLRLRNTDMDEETRTIPMDFVASGETDSGEFTFSMVSRNGNNARVVKFSLGKKDTKTLLAQLAAHCSKHAKP